MSDTEKASEEKRNLESRLAEALKKITELDFELKIVREERDKAIGEKYLSLAKQKEQQEDHESLVHKFQFLENSFVSLKIEHANLKASYESLKDDSETTKKFIQIRDNEIRNLMKSQEFKKPTSQCYPRAQVANKPPVNKNLRPFPSTSFSFNLIGSNRSSHSNSLRDEDH